MDNWQRTMMFAEWCVLGSCAVTYPCLPAQAPYPVPFILWLLADSSDCKTSTLMDELRKKPEKGNIPAKAWYILSPFRLGSCKTAFILFYLVGWKRPVAISFGLTQFTQIICRQVSFVPSVRQQLLQTSWFTTPHRCVYPYSPCFPLEETRLSSESLGGNAELWGSWSTQTILCSRYLSSLHFYSPTTTPFLGKSKGGKREDG